MTTRKLSRPFGAILTALALALAVLAAQAQPIAYDAKSIKQGQFLTLYVRTAKCMQQGTAAMLRQGVREPAPIQAFTIGTCGPSLRGWLITQDGMSQADADGLLAHMAARALQAATDPLVIIL
jgi:hypothetical protein